MEQYPVYRPRNPGGAATPLVGKSARKCSLRKARARAPLRLGLAGGGTDLAPYCDVYGGNVLNCTISAYAYATVCERTDGMLSFSANDIGESELLTLAAILAIDTGLRLHRAVYNRMVRDYNGGRPLALDVHTSVDAPPGSGLGSSSALVVALVKAYSEFLDIPVSDYELAYVSFEIERVDLAMAGGKQDQYAAAFGGCNFIEFLPNDRVIVNPLRVHEAHKLEVESSFLVCHTGRSRMSSAIIEQQTDGMRRLDSSSLAAMNQIKHDAVEMKLAMLRGDVGLMADILRSSWAAKKRTATAVTNGEIDEIYDAALASGALAGKISGAGGGGFMMFLVPPEQRPQVAKALIGRQLLILPFQFTDRGAESWIAG